jgi:hypothetical protein
LEGAGTHLIPIPCALRRPAGAHVTSCEKARTKHLSTSSVRSNGRARPSQTHRSTRRRQWKRPAGLRLRHQKPEDASTDHVPDDYAERRGELPGARSGNGWPRRRPTRIGFERGQRRPAENRASRHEVGARHLGGSYEGIGTLTNPVVASGKQPVQGFKGSRVQRFKGSRVQRFNGSTVQNEGTGSRNPPNNR